jgi:septum site-determining protein MinC
MANETAAAKIKNASLQFFVLHLLTTDLDRIEAQLTEQLAQTPDFFSATPVVLGLAGIADQDTVPDFAELGARLRRLGLHPAGAQGGSPAQRASALQAGLGLFPDKPARAPAPEPRPAEAEPAATAPAAPAEPAPLAPPRTATLVIDKPVRTGQRIHAADADLVVLASVNAGAELIADGDIHVYGSLRGRALAGARGNTGARIFARSMEAELVSIAGLFQVFENGIPDAVRGKSAQVYLDGERVVLQALPADR